MRKETDISVIVPVYNAEKYLEECIESVIEQENFASCEILLTDDMSTDGSAAILERYAAQYSNIRRLTYEQPLSNRGVSAVRNLGLRAARGKYVFFLDSDDRLEQGYLAHLQALAEEKDCRIVYAGFSRLQNGVSRPVFREVLQREEWMTGEELLRYRMDRKDRYNYVWCALYETAFLREHGLEFDEEIRIYEDMLFTLKAALAADRVAATEEYGYLYRVRTDSLVQDKLKRRDVESAIQVLEKLCQEPGTQTLYRFLYSLVSMSLYYMGTLADRKKIKVDQSDRYWQKMKKDIPWGPMWKAGNLRERFQWLLWRTNWRWFYLLVRKKEH